MKKWIKKGWFKTILYFATWLLTQFIVFVAITLVLRLTGSKVNFFQGSTEVTILMIGTCIQMLSTLFTTWIFCKYIEHISFKEVGLAWKTKSRDFLSGSILGIVLISLGSGVLLSLGLISVQSFTVNAVLLLKSLILFIAVAINEEVMARGNILRTLMESMGKYWALVVSAAIFSLLHGLNPGISFIGFTNIFLAGILLGIYYIHTKNLWFPIGLHLTWNYFQGPVWGYSVSGEEIKGMVTQKLTGNDLFTGGKFGFEASLICTIIMVAAIILIDWIARKNVVSEPLVTKDIPG
jgi:hypothetical protein